MNASGHNLIHMHNPHKQYIFVTLDTFSPRNYPRNARCKPNDNIVLYFDHADGSPVGDAYAGLWQVGTKTLGKFNARTPVGDYNIHIVNQNSGSSDVTLNVYYGNTAQPPTLTQ